MASRKNTEATTRETATSAIKEPGPEKAVEKQRKPAQAKTISVTFFVTAPEGTGKRQAVFLSGALQALNARLPDWDPQGLPMKRTADGRYTLTIKITPGSDLYYKYTLGSWEQVEMDENCREVPNRHARLHDLDSGEQVINDTVQNWRGMGACS